MCLESTFVDRNGERKSKIVPQLYRGSFVTTPRTEVHLGGHRIRCGSPQRARASGPA
ncbi:MAG: hypothetical protein ACOX3D_12130 [Syntrophomonadales bacterium]